jgi:hypothetical protein
VARTTHTGALSNVSRFARKPRLILRTSPQLRGCPPYISWLPMSSLPHTPILSGKRSESGLTYVDGDWAVKGRRRKRVRFSGCGGEIQTVVFVVRMEVGEIDAVRELISAGGEFGTRRYIDKLIFELT